MSNEMSGKTVKREKDRGENKIGEGGERGRGKNEVER